MAYRAAPIHLRCKRFAPLGFLPVPELSELYLPARSPETGVAPTGPVPQDRCQADTVSRRQLACARPPQHVEESNA